MPEIDLEPNEYRTKRPHAVWSPAIWLFEVLPAYFHVRRREKREQRRERDTWYRAATPLWLRILVWVSGPWLLAVLLFATSTKMLPLVPALVVAAIPAAIALVAALVRS